MFQVQALSKLQSKPSKIRKTAKIPHKKYNHLRESLTTKRLKLSKQRLREKLEKKNIPTKYPRRKANEENHNE